MSSQSPIGVFDSGLGGLSVVREIRLRLPHEELVYIADSAYCPYGGRTLEEIRERSVAVTEALLEHNAKLIVIACNTASGAAIDHLRHSFTVPIVGLEPALKPAALSSKSGRIAVLATPATLRTERFHRLIDKHGAEVEVLRIPCPGFVELVESGEIAGEKAMAKIGEVLEPLRDTGVDRVVLGCTHYPFLRESIAAVVGDGVEILDSGAAVARQVERVLKEKHLLSDSREAGQLTLYTTGDPDTVESVAQRLLGEDITMMAVSA
jgi:glutamate racemase